MSRLLVRDCDVVVTMDDGGTELAGGSILAEEGVIRWAGTGPPPAAAGAGAGTQVIDGRGCLAVPGLVNTHHHLFQVLTRARATGRGLVPWLSELYPVWAGLDAEWLAVAAAAGLAELALSGCSASADHHYLFPAGTGDLLEAEIAAAAGIGLRLHCCRGSLDLGASRGGLPPDSLTEDPARVLAATHEAVSRYHDPTPGAMVRIAVGPCSLFTTSQGLMSESAALARSLEVRLHTHAAETREEEEYCRERFGRRPVELLEDLGVLGPGAWLAHCVQLTAGDISRIAASGAAVAHCPGSNLRLGSGVAPVRDLTAAGVPVGLGVDGSASNDGAHLLGEARQALLVARGRDGAPAMSPRQALSLATRGGAACLGRDDIGAIEPGRRADIALFPADDLASAGADADPVAGLLLAWPRRVRHLIVEGRVVVRDGALATADESGIAARAHEAARRILTRGRA